MTAKMTEKEFIRYVIKMAELIDNECEWLGDPNCENAKELKTQAQRQMEKK
jgi:hypothetical protein